MCIFQVGPGAVWFDWRLYVIIADVPVVHHSPVDVAVFNLNATASTRGGESRLDKLG